MINRVRDNITTFEQRSGNYKGKKYSILLFASLCKTLHLQQDFDLRTTMAESLELWKMIKRRIGSWFSRHFFYLITPVALGRENTKCRHLSRKRISGKRSLQGVFELVKIEKMESEAPINGGLVPVYPLTQRKLQNLLQVTTDSPGPLLILVLRQSLGSFHTPPYLLQSM